MWSLAESMVTMLWSLAESMVTMLSRIVVIGCKYGYDVVPDCGNWLAETRLYWVKNDVSFRN